MTPRHRFPAFLAGSAAALLLALAGCSYQLESPRLPGDASTLALGTFNNRTFTGELDIRLQHRLRDLLLRNPGFELTDVSRSDLVLDVEITGLDIARARNLASTNLSSESYTMTGLVSLYDRRARRYEFNGRAVVGSFNLDFDAPTTETPAIRDQGLDGAVQDFARNVEALLFYSF
ncbi:MAG TPA: hypothetical protein VL359_14540 [bacterium]|nr:hypothetical protein [bacterium]